MSERLKIELKRQINYMRDALQVISGTMGWIRFLQDNLEERTPPRFIRWLFAMPKPIKRMDWGILENVMEAGEARILEMEKALREEQDDDSK